MHGIVSYCNLSSDLYFTFRRYPIEFKILTIVIAMNSWLMPQVTFGILSALDVLNDSYAMLPSISLDPPENIDNSNNYNDSSNNKSYYLAHEMCIHI